MLKVAPTSSVFNLKLTLANKLLKVFFLGAKFQLLADTAIYYLTRWPTLNIASPDLLSALQNWHDGVIWDPTPPLIASEEEVVGQMKSRAEDQGGSRNEERNFSGSVRAEVGVDWPYRCRG